MRRGWWFGMSLWLAYALCPRGIRPLFAAHVQGLAAELAAIRDGETNGSGTISWTALGSTNQEEHRRSKAKWLIRWWAR